VGIIKTKTLKTLLKCTEKLAKILVNCQRSRPDHSYKGAFAFPSAEVGCPRAKKAADAKCKLAAMLSLFILHTNVWDIPKRTSAFVGQHLGGVGSSDDCVDHAIHCGGQPF
jgi:hypothetical protein